MNSLYRSSCIYFQHHFLPRVCATSANAMTSRACASTSPTRKKKQSTESEGTTDYDQPLSASKNKSSRRTSKDALSLQTSFGCRNENQSSMRRHTSNMHAPLDTRKDTSFRHQSKVKEANGASVKRSRYQKDGLPLKEIWVPKNKDQSPKKRHDLPFDICSLDHQRNDTSIQDWNLVEEANTEVTEQTVQLCNKHRVLGPGMVLLKHYLPLHVQADIVKTCRELGLKPKGFYQPGYRVGSKLHLQMMCLGRNWDPQTKYGKIDSDTPDIPATFSALVEKAIQEAQTLIDREDAECILPMMSPDICIVNFYSETGRLGLHQDRDESQESIKKGLPIVSFSIGDSAEFLYGVERDVEEAEQVMLESGDVLIFGGESRMIFHGVKSIIPNSAPMLLSESKLRTGRLNLTFRHF